MGRFNEAVAAGHNAVRSAPDSPVAWHQLATSRLACGELTAEVWQQFEWRLRLHGTPAWINDKARWTGGDVRGKTVLLHAEQGLGDTLQFVRYAALVAARGARVILAVQSSLVRLLRSVPGVSDIVGIGGPLPPFDLFCPLLSLPRLFGTTLATVQIQCPTSRQAARSRPAVGASGSALPGQGTKRSPMTGSVPWRPRTWRRLAASTAWRFMDCKSARRVVQTGSA